MIMGIMVVGIKSFGVFMYEFLIFPMDVRVDDVPCYPYMLLRRRGSFDDADCTPYFFQSQQRRDETVAYLSQILDAVRG